MATNVSIPTVPFSQPSPKRYLVALLDGTWGDRHKPNTIINHLASILSCPDVVVGYFQGVGTFGSLTDRYIGGAVGVGVKSNLFNAYSWFITNYNPGDGILLLGYSRGAFTARSLAGLIHLVGIPSSGPLNKKAGAELFNAYTSGKLKDPAFAQTMRKVHKCHEDVIIGFLGCFDTVGSLGIPDTGVLAFLKLSRPLRKRIQFHQTNIGNTVRYAFHAAAIHERRASFMLTPMHIHENSTCILHQVYFFGSHGDLGTVNSGASGLFLYPLASMLQHMKNAYPDFPFNNAKLKEAFPNSSFSAQSRSSSPMVAAEVKRTQSILWKLTGSSTRKPGSNYKYEYRTNETIDSSVGTLSVADPEYVVPGFTLEEVNGTMKWVNRKREVTIPVAEYGEFQAQLLGWPWFRR